MTLPLWVVTLLLALVSLLSVACVVAACSRKEEWLNLLMALNSLGKFCVSAWLFCLLLCNLSPVCLSFLFISIICCMTTSFGCVGLMCFPHGAHLSPQISTQAHPSPHPTLPVTVHEWVTYFLSAVFVFCENILAADRLYPVHCMIATGGAVIYVVWR